MKNRRQALPSNSSHTKKKEGCDHGTVERWQHAGRLFEPTERAGIVVARAVDADVLDQLVLAGLIATSHRDAALRLRSDFHEAGMSPHLAGSYSATRSSFSFFGGWDERTEREEQAYRRWRDAVRAMGPMVSGTVLSIVCYDENPAPNKLTLLTVGLVKLAKWYRSAKRSDEQVDQTAAGEGATGCGRGDCRHLLH